MAYETGAPPPPDHTPVDVGHSQVQEVPIAATRPAKGFDATSVISGIAGLPPGTVTYRLRGTETTETD